MKTLLSLLQVCSGLATLGLLGLAIIKSYHGHASRRLARWILGFMVAFVTFTIMQYEIHPFGF